MLIKTQFAFKVNRKICKNSNFSVQICFHHETQWKCDQKITRYKKFPDCMKNKLTRTTNKPNKR